MSNANLPERAPLVDVDASERLSADDMATRREEEFRAAAWEKVKAEGGMVIERGVCVYCAAACLPLAVYCDAECRLGHERLLAAQVRQGRGARA